MTLSRLLDWIDGVGFGVVFLKTGQFSPLGVLLHHGGVLRKVTHRKCLIQHVLSTQAVEIIVLSVAPLFFVRLVCSCLNWSTLAPLA